MMTPECFPVKTVSSCFTLYVISINDTLVMVAISLSCSESMKSYTATNVSLQQIETMSWSRQISYSLPGHRLKMCSVWGYGSLITTCQRRRCTLELLSFHSTHLFASSEATTPRLSISQMMIVMNCVTQCHTL